MTDHNDTIIYRMQFSENLSRVLKKKKIIYIGCHTGWGKTTAVRSWLDETQQAYKYASAYDDDFWEKLSSAEFQKAKLVVLDDLYVMNEMEDTNSLVEQFASTGCKYVLISRTALPSYLKPFAITQQLEFFGIDDLAFSAKEIEQLFEMNCVSYTESICKAVTERMKGWPLSIDLLAKRLKNEEYSENIFALVKWISLIILI